MIDRKCKVTLGGLPQKIHVKGDETKPVLLFLHGGPGVCNRHTVMTVHADLQKEFLVVAWDQRGSGGSYRGAAVETLTIDRLVDDAHELVLWLCREYGRKKGVPAGRQLGLGTGHMAGVPLSGAHCGLCGLWAGRQWGEKRGTELSICAG